MSALNISSLKSVISYNNETGMFIWQSPTGSRAKKGSQAGSKRADGYVLIKFMGNASMHIDWHGCS